MIRITKAVLLLSFIFFSGSCNKNIFTAENKETVLYPAPPSTARIQHLTSFGNSEDITGERSKFKTFVMGPADILAISKPYGIASDNGRILVCDPPDGGLKIIDLENNTLKVFRPEGQGELRQPLNCAIDNNGKTYIADIARKQVLIFNSEDKFEAAISGPLGFRPTDVTVSAKYIYITDPDNNKVHIYNIMTRDLIKSFPEDVESGDEGWLYNPMNITLSDDFVYITDFGHSRIKKFTPLGEYISSTGSYGRNLGQFTRPKGIAADKENNLYVVDAAFSNVQIFNREGQLLLFFGGAYSGKPGDMYMPSKVVVDYKNLDYFRDLVDPAYELKYLILVTNQFGPDKVNIYGRIDPR